MALSPKIAFVTASYAGDFERARLLCETMDRRASGWSRHLLLVSGPDRACFEALSGPKRQVVDERDILPSWLHDWPDPVKGRRVWLSLRAWPMRGWHVQQLRKIAIADHVEEEVLVYVDSDVAFVHPFDCAAMVEGGRVRLFRRAGELLGRAESEQHVWSRSAGRLLGLGDAVSPHDYIATLIAWRSHSVRAMTARIEAVTGRSWVAALGRSRRFSECMLYGRFADEVEEAGSHFHSGTELCRVYWSGPRLGADGMRRFIDEMERDQVAVALQSFTGADPQTLRSTLSLAA